MPLLGSADSFSSDEARVSGIAEPSVGEVSAAQLRKMQISEFSAWLRTQTNKHQRPFQEDTIRGYAETARALDLWMAGQDIDGDFTGCDAAVLNEFFAAYRNAHSQGGTNTRQRNLHHLFKWLTLRYDHPDPRVVAGLLACHGLCAEAASSAHQSGTLDGPIRLSGAWSVV
jgi:hypothetical protein